MSAGDRITDYDRIADRYDTRYGVYAYDGVRDTLSNFLGPESHAALEVGCGTGHWLGPKTIGLDPSANMLARARITHPTARLVRGRAETLPWRDGSFDRIYCVNALHHFSDRAAFFAEAHRVLKPGGGLLTIGKDPHTDHDDWWVYTYFEQTREIDRARYARVRTLRGEMALAGFAWTESMEADRIEAVRPLREAVAAGVVEPSFTSQLTVLSESEYAAGVEKMRQANQAAGGELQLIADFRLYATIGWVS
jgi:ubiquinone/menaquinone biosynthesis C-methylase UbiE